MGFAKTLYPSYGFPNIYLTNPAFGVKHSHVMPGLDPGIHLPFKRQSWIVGSSPAMTEKIK
jgi:hypothetical protein